MNYTITFVVTEGDMQKKQSPILVLFQRCALVLLYLCFFIVQFSANYNYATQSNNFSFSTNHFTKHGNDVAAISKADKSDDRKVNIRLNKRFAPSSTLYCEAFFSLKTNTYTLVKKQAIIYIAPHLPASHLQIKALRGPPIVVA